MNRVLHPLQFVLHFLAAYAAVNIFDAVNPQQPVFLAAYAAVNTYIAATMPMMSFLAAYAAVNALPATC